MSAEHPAAQVHLTVAEALAEVFLAAPDTTLALTVEDRVELLRALDDFGTSERAAALDLLAELIRKAEGDPTTQAEALRLVALLKERNGDA